MLGNISGHQFAKSLRHIDVFKIEPVAAHREGSEHLIAAGIARKSRAADIYLEKRRRIRHRPTVGFDKFPLRGAQIVALRCAAPAILVSVINAIERINVFILIFFMIPLILFVAVAVAVARATIDER